MRLDKPVFITTDAVGGVWNYSLALADGFVAAGRPVILAVVGPAPTPEQRSAIPFDTEHQCGSRLYPRVTPGRPAACSLISTGLDLDWTVTSGPALRGMAAELASLAARLEASTAHLHAPCLANAAWSIPTIATAHSCMASWWKAVHGAAPPREIAFHRDATAAGLVEAEAIIAPSQSFADALSTLYDIPRPVCVIYNGLAPSTSARTEPRRDFVLAAGRLWDEGKNLATLDLAAADCVLPIHAAGPIDAPHGGGLRARHLRLLGRLPNADLRALAGEAAAFASPSLYEPFGLAVLEAAQAATPLILADIRTFRELWDGAAVFVPPRDASAWTVAINALAGDLDRRDELGRAARMRARCYTQSAMVETTLALHEKARVHRVEAA